VGIFVRGGTLALFTTGLPIELMRSSFDAGSNLSRSRLSLTGGTGGIWLLRLSRRPEKRPLILSKTYRLFERERGS
jgi:hypothetical protein